MSINRGCPEQDEETEYLQQEFCTNHVSMKVDWTSSQARYLGFSQNMVRNPQPNPFADDVMERDSEPETFEGFLIDPPAEEQTPAEPLYSQITLPVKVGTTESRAWDVLESFLPQDAVVTVLWNEAYPFRSNQLIIDLPNYRAMEVEKILMRIHHSPELKNLMAIPDNCKSRNLVQCNLLLPNSLKQSSAQQNLSPEDYEIFPDTEVEKLPCYQQQVFNTPVINCSQPEIAGQTIANITSLQEGKLQLLTSNKLLEIDGVYDHNNSLLEDVTKVKDFGALGSRLLLNHESSGRSILFAIDKPVKIFNEKWESVGETAAHFMGRMIKNSWNATSRGAKLVGDVVYFLALPDKFQKDDKGFSLKDLPGRLMRFNVKSPSIQEDELEQDVSDFDVNPKDKPDYAYISNSNQIHNGELVYDLSTQGVEFLTCILRIEKKFVVAGWIRKSNTAVYFALDHDFKNISMCSVANEQERTAPKGPVSQLAWTTLRTPEIQGLPIVIAGTTTGAINILALSKRKITLVANDYANKSTGNCSMSVLEHDGTIYIGGNSFFKKFRLKYTDTKT